MQKRYIDYPELLDYCRRSANLIGWLLEVCTLPIAPAKKTLPFDCASAQRCNSSTSGIIAIDWQKQRVYIPQTDLERYRINER